MRSVACLPVARVRLWITPQ